MPSRKPPRQRRRTPTFNTDEAQAYAAHLLSIGMQKGDVKRELCRKFGKKASINTLEKILTGARDLLVKASGISVDDHRDNAYRVYHSLVSNPKKGDWLRLKAQERIDKLLALEGPVKVELSGGLTHTARVAAAVLKEPAARELLDALGNVFAAKREPAAAPPPEPPRGAE